jgi:hypothetical protein
MIAQIGLRHGMLGKRNTVGFICAVGARILKRAVFDAKRG